MGKFHFFVEILIYDTTKSEAYILSLQRNRSHFCGGTLISATNGICASHCVYPGQAHKIQND